MKSEKGGGGGQCQGLWGGQSKSVEGVDIFNIRSVTVLVCGNRDSRSYGVVLMCKYERDTDREDIDFGFGWCAVLLKRHSSIVRRPGRTCKHVRALVSLPTIWVVRCFIEATLEHS